MKEMKKLFNLTAILSAVLFVGCSTIDDELSEMNNEERGVVKTEFSISYPVRANGTRMTSAVVQTSANLFRGITGIKLYPFAVNKSTVEGTNTTSLAVPITLGHGGSSLVKAGYSSISADNQIDGTGALYTTNNSHLYKDIEIPIGTQSFMFYGKAIGATAAAPSTTLSNFQKGVLNETNTGGGSSLQVKDILFSLQPITSSNSVTTAANTVATYLTSIANAHVGSDTYPTGYWCNTDNVILSTLYNNFISMEAGSYASIKGAVQQLYKSIYTRTDDLSVAIKAAITATDGLGTDKTVTNTNEVLTFPELTSGGYPADLNLPDGAAYIDWLTASHEFNAVTTLTSDAILNMAPLTNYVYPAELYYRVISNIRVANKSMADAYQDGVAWSAIYGAEGYSTSDASVASTTRSIALVDQAQYAVGRLDVNVAASSATLTDKEGTNFAADGTTSSLFKVTGILVGNQKNVNYLFRPTGDDVYTIYDKELEVPNHYLSTTSTLVNHTLVLETAAEAEVKIAVEFEYSSSATNPIVSDHGLIYPGTKFYMIGSLKPETDSGIKTFEQDKYTVATINISKLDKAYNVLPDLRAPQLELGLSINLEWLAGFTQTITID